jgi:hypothetical protein
LRSPASCLLLSASLYSANKRIANSFAAIELRNSHCTLHRMSRYAASAKPTKEIVMRKTIIALIALSAAFPAFAADLAKDMMLGKTADEVKVKLVEMGYEVRKTGTEDGKIEVYAVKDGKTAEVYIDPATGMVTDIK